MSADAQGAAFKICIMVLTNILSLAGHFYMHLVIKERTSKETASRYYKIDIWWDL